ncbi:MAG: hypothetical protein JXB14_00080 [Candidatus Altiarchaeota archaeon]|nr:hypothetical protein [Candidatus Altiarchaeota archaeon]
MAKDRLYLDYLGQKVFDIRDEPMPRGAWWWWFWLFFFDNPANPPKPRQLMILWSVKNTKKIECNGLRMRLEKIRDRSVMDGAVAAWYFDGAQMHHNFLLEQCDISVSETQVASSSKVPTSFSADKNKNTVRIGDDFDFVARMSKAHKFMTPNYCSHNYIGNLGYSILKANRLDLTGKVRGETIKGTAYFQRVFVNAPAVPWYWGLFHFGNGGVLSYFNPHFFGKAVKKDISFFDGKKLHEFHDIRVKRSGGDIPTFSVSGANKDESIEFEVESYAHSWWEFRKKALGFIPTKLVYNEYPAVISDFRLINKLTGEETLLRDLGESVGNAEHTTGLLF